MPMPMAGVIGLVAAMSNRTSSWSDWPSLWMAHRLKTGFHLISRPGDSIGRWELASRSPLSVWTRWARKWWSEASAAVTREVLSLRALSLTSATLGYRVRLGLGLG